MKIAQHGCQNRLSCLTLPKGTIAWSCSSVFKSPDYSSPIGSDPAFGRKDESFAESQKIMARVRTRFGLAVKSRLQQNNQLYRKKGNCFVTGITIRRATAATLDAQFKADWNQRTQMHDDSRSIAAETP